MKKIRITESQLKSIVKRMIKEESSKLMEMGKDDINFKAIINKYEESSETSKKSIASVILGSVDYKNFNPLTTKDEIEKKLSEMGYQDIKSIRKTLGIRY